MVMELLKVFKVKVVLFISIHLVYGPYFIVLSLSFPSRSLEVTEKQLTSGSDAAADRPGQDPMSPEL